MMYQHDPFHTTQASPKTGDNSKKPLIIVIGGGPVAVRFAYELLARQPQAKLWMFGNEPYHPYNRVQLSSLLAGDIAYDAILSTLPDSQKHPNFRYEVNKIDSIDTAFQTVTDSKGIKYVYEKLVIATGSRPHVPSIKGVAQKGVYTFRNLRDAENLYARRSRSRHTVVVGGGLLGLEAARAMCQLNTEVTVVQQGPRLMNRQLDNAAAALLQSDVEALGVNVICEQGVREILGQALRVNSVLLRDGQKLACDTVLLCAGIKSNLEIARNARIKVARGILVNDQMQSSTLNVYAIGECCEHRGLVYGLVNPGFEQAAIAAADIATEHVTYQGSLEISRLKVVGSDVCSMGEIEQQVQRPFLRELKYHNKKQNIYRKITVHRGRVIAAVAYGEWPESRRIQEAFQQQRRLWPWQQIKFLLNGYVWAKDAANDPKLWPASAVICQCNNINKGTLSNAIALGHTTPAALGKACQAGTVCGSCKPLLTQLCGTNLKQEKEKLWQAYLIVSVCALLLIAAFSFFPAQQTADSVLDVSTFEKIWNDKYWKQVSGFSLLSMSTLGLLMSLRKRLKWTFMGDFTNWRIVHIGLGLSCAGLLFVHTGLHFGANLNQVLMLNFIAVLCLGAIAGIALSLSHTLPAKTALNLKRSASWVHILICWPLPILLATHILTVYYF